MRSRESVPVSGFTDQDALPIRGPQRTAAGADPCVRSMVRSSRRLARGARCQPSHEDCFGWFSARSRSRARTQTQTPEQSALARLLSAATPLVVTPWQGAAPRQGVAETLPPMVVQQALVRARAAQRLAAAAAARRRQMLGQTTSMPL